MIYLNTRFGFRDPRETLPISKEEMEKYEEWCKESDRKHNSFVFKMNHPLLSLIWNPYDR